MNTYMLFGPEDHRMDQKYIVAAICTWEGQEVKWAKVVQYRINEEIQTRKAQSTLVIYLFSVFYISCLCEGKKDEVTTPRGISPLRPKSPDSPTLAEIEVQLGHTRVRMRELEVQLFEKETN